MKSVFHMKKMEQLYSLSIIVYYPQIWQIKITHIFLIS